jgi:hypothetical protein
MIDRHDDGPLSRPWKATPQGVDGSVLSGHSLNVKDHAR